jgi:hypothetical protein
MTMTGFEKFPQDQLQTLRNELMQSGLDSFQAAELLAAFLVQHGYGVSNDEARVAASRMESMGFSLPLMQEELERIAYVT